jgi:LPXTG-site transpeptidase (sortase) family protein
MYVNNGTFANTEQDVLVQVDHFADASYPSNATDTIVARVSALNTSSEHEYLHFSHGTYSPSPGCSIDSWVNGERNNLCGGVAPAQYWVFNLAETWTWATFSTTHTFWRNPGTTYASSNPVGRPVVLSGVLSPAQPGYFGLAPAQSRGWWDNLLIRRYTEPEPSTTLGPEEIYAPPQIVDPKTDSLFADADGNGVPSPGDTLGYAFTVSNIGGSHATNALFTDTPDPNTTLEIGSVLTSQGVIQSGNNPGDTAVSILIGMIPPAATITISFRVIIDDPLAAGVDQISNQGLLSGDNFPDTPTDDPATAAAGDPTLTLIARLSASLPSTGFAPGQWLSPEEAEPAVRYTPLAGMKLHIPAIGLTLPVYGVPLGGEGWDVSWLGLNVGYLEGTAFPTWPGNSVLTGHVILANGVPGPFARLDQLKWDDRIEINFGGSVNTYVVRSLSYVEADDIRVLQHEDLDWLTLITCAAFDPVSGKYQARVVVRAVLIQIRQDETSPTNSR